MVTIDCISDIHGEFPVLEGGDLLIVAGDLTASYSAKEFKTFFDWLIAQDYNHKIVIGGNHDSYLQKMVMYGEISKDLGKQYDEDDNFIGYGYYYLCDSSVTIDGYKIYGTPWTRRFEGMNSNCMAFTVETDSELAVNWYMIPDDTDILITHCPPYGMWDESKRSKEHCGSTSLRDAVLDRIKPRLHVFGHIHEWGGRIYDSGRTKFVNASIMNEDYEAVNKPVRIVL